MYDTTIATKLLRQLESFLGRISPRFHKPVARFIGDMMYGIMAEKDVKLSSVVRALKEGITPKKVEDRLSRMLSSKGLERGLHDAIAAEGAGKVHQDTLIILDPSDVQKPYAKKMEPLHPLFAGAWRFSCPKNRGTSSAEHYIPRALRIVSQASLIRAICSVAAATRPSDAPEARRMSG